MSPAPLRLFLDAGIIIQGCFTPWGASKAVLVLTTLREHFTVVLADSIRQEVESAVDRRTAKALWHESAPVGEALEGWLAKVRIERWPYPAEDEIERQVLSLMPVLRHQNDLPSLVAALHARPDWVLSTNTVHWSPDLAARTGLRIATPAAFLAVWSSQARAASVSQPSPTAADEYRRALAAYLADQHPVFPPFGEIVMRMIQKSYSDPIVDQTVIELHSDGTFRPEYTGTLLLPLRYDGFQIFLPEQGDRRDGDRVISRAPLVRVAPRIPFGLQAAALQTALYAALDVALRSAPDVTRAPVYIDTAASGYSHALEFFLDLVPMAGIARTRAFQRAVQWVLDGGTTTSRIGLITLYQNGAWTTQHLTLPLGRTPNSALIRETSGLQLFLPEWGDTRTHSAITAHAPRIPVAAGMPFEQQEATLAAALRTALQGVLASALG